MITDVLIKIGAVLALLAALFFGEQYIEGLGYDRRAAEDKAQIEAQKKDAEHLRAQLTQERLDNATALANLKTQLETQRETLQTANTADLHRRLTGPGLRYVAPQAAGCGRGGASPTSPAPGPTGDPATAATVVQLPERISDDLYTLLGYAQSLAIDYGVLYEYTHNPHLVCELRP